MNTAALLEVTPDVRYTDVSSEKSDGAHYTPRNLADFVANQIVSCLPQSHQPLSVLDPAIGDGELVLALLTALKKHGVEKVEVYGFETNASAMQAAKVRIKAEFPDTMIHLSCESFLKFVLRTYRPDIFSFLDESRLHFDVAIANPPYVRTQVMGAKQAQELARQFNLSGRVDLYHAFLLAIAEALKPGGIVGIIVSNRFMTTKSGAAVRTDILKQFNVRHIWDLGDTKIFAAAVLPAVLLLEKKSKEIKADVPHFSSVYASKAAGTATSCMDVVEGLRSSGLVEDRNGNSFFVEHGVLDHGANQTGVWRIKTDTSTDWLAKVHAHTWGKFKDIGKIRVGVKTTADKVFIRSDWERMPVDTQPELLKPLITHHIARRFRSQDVSRGSKILYPHVVIDGKRCAVALKEFPRAAKYLEQHRHVLEARTYVIESGRNWYEIWVPQDPAAWEAPKLVFRDICEHPTFWIDLEGSVVNGDCYWLTCNRPEHERLLWLALAVGNSTFAEEFYDRCFCNKLYAGRRRFCTQYVEHFPLPYPDQALSQQMIKLAKQLYHESASSAANDLERQLNVLTWQAFGVSVEERTG